MQTGAGDDGATQSSGYRCGKAHWGRPFQALAEAGWHVVLHYNQAATEAQALQRHLLLRAELLNWFRLIWPSRMILTG